MSYSSSYYYRTYYRFFLTSDLAPQILRGKLTTEMIETFMYLATTQVNHGDESKNFEIRKRLELEDLPKP